MPRPPTLARGRRLLRPREGEGYDVELVPPRRAPERVREAVARGEATLAPYSALAAPWHRYWRALVPRYGPYLRELAAAGAVGRAGALDLACGTGLAAEELAAIFDRVVALDASEAMLAEAGRRLAGLPNVALRRGDFRAFRLPERVDVAVCAGDSLNHAASPAELAAAFACVRAALRPGGLFLFDLASRVAFLAAASRAVHVTAPELEWWQLSRFDRRTRRETAFVVTDHGVERHERRYFGPREVRAAAKAAGLAIEERLRLRFRDVYRALAR